MARGNASRLLATKTKTLPNNVPRMIRAVQEEIDRHWERMPSRVKPFLLEELSVDSFTASFSELAKFWSARAMVEYMRDGVGGFVGREHVPKSWKLALTSWNIALKYLELGQLRKASCLTVNGAFLHQYSVSNTETHRLLYFISQMMRKPCHQSSLTVHLIDLLMKNTPIEKLVEMCGPNFNQVIDYTKVQLFSQGFNSLQTRLILEVYLQGKLNGHHLFSKAKEYIGEIANDWTGSSPARGRNKHDPSLNARAQGGTPIQLIVVDGTNKDDRQEFDILSSTALKSLFNEYAEKRGVSLRLLRFSYNGRTLFLSSAGNKSPNELSMKDQGIITVHETCRETSNNKSEISKSLASTKSKTKKVETKKSARRRARGKGNKRQTKQGKPEKTLEEHKAQHSKMLSRLHEEVEHRLKGIRTRLNALDLERQPPKQRRNNEKRKRAVRSRADPPRLPDAGLGGRAGRPSFVVNVGEVQNLYKTTKSSRRSSYSAFTLDLHSYSREETLVRLDESLKLWVNAAMGGSYPFVVQVTIVCGCGNQILEETVERWIRTSKNVGNSPSRALH